MKKIQICMGSACHIKGAPLVAQTIQAELARLGLIDGVDVELMGAFCQNQCLDGVVVKIDGDVYTKVTPADVTGILNHAFKNGEE